MNSSTNMIETSPHPTIVEPQDAGSLSTPFAKRKEPTISADALNHTFNGNNTTTTPCSSSTGICSPVKKVVDADALLKKSPSLTDHQPSSSSSSQNGNSPKSLPSDFQPGPFDVWCGRGRACKNAPGNIAYRKAVLEKLPAYAAATTKLQKGGIITGIVDDIRRKCHEYHLQKNGWSECGGFVKKDTVSGEWTEVGDFLAREKTSQCFRDALSNNYSSSAQNKYQRRRAREQLLSASQHSKLEPQNGPHLQQPQQQHVSSLAQLMPLMHPKKKEIHDGISNGLLTIRELEEKPSNSHLPPKKRKCRAPEDYAVADVLQSMASMSNPAPPVVAVTYSSSESTPVASPAPHSGSGVSSRVPADAPSLPQPPTPSIPPRGDHQPSTPPMPIMSATIRRAWPSMQLDEVRVCALQPYLRAIIESPLDAVLRVQHQMQAIASSQVVDMFVLPELAPIGYSEHTFARFLPVTLENQRMYNEMDRVFQETARTLGVYICYGTIGHTTTNNNNDNGSNAATPPKMSIRQVVVDRSGMQIAAYDKTHLCNYGVCAETRFFQPGPFSRPVSFEVKSRDGNSSFRFGLLICADMRYPELSRALAAEHRVDCILQPAAFARDCSFRTWSSFRETRAVENSVYWVGVNYAGCDYGESSIVTPWVDDDHEPLTLGPEQGFVIGRICRTTLDQVRTTMPFYRNLIGEGESRKPGSSGV